MDKASCLNDGTLLQGGKYRIVRFLGAGGFGCTYEAHFGLLDARVAIKEFFPETMCNRDAAGCISVPTDNNRVFVGKMRRKFVQEARTLYKYKDIDGIVKVADIFEENGTAYFVMDFIDGNSVQNLIDSRGRLAEADALRIIRSVGQALQAVHAFGSLHLDIKPDNIMIGANGRPVLIDFGVSKQFNEEEGCNTSTLMGYTPGYAPLEQMNSNVHSFSPATDVYALGATLYAMLTGKRPPKPTDLLNDVETLQFPEDVSHETCSAIKAAMQFKVKDRPQSVVAFLAMLPTEASAKLQSTPQPVPQLIVNTHSAPKPIQRHKPVPVPKLQPVPVSTQNVKGQTQLIGQKQDKRNSDFGIVIFFTLIIVVMVVVGIFYLPQWIAP